MATTLEPQINHSPSSCGIILIGGGQASGKLTTSIYIAKQLQESPLLRGKIDIKLLDMEKYIYAEEDLAKKSSALSVNTETNNLTSANNTELLAYKKYKNGGPWLPGRFNFKKIIEQVTTTEKSSSKFPIFVVHGLYALYNLELNSKAMMKIFLDIDADTRLVRWVQQDTVAKKGDLAELLQKYLGFSRPEFNEFIHPTKENADTILTHGAEVNDTGVTLICDGLAPLIAAKIREYEAGKDGNKENVNDKDIWMKTAEVNSPLMSGSVVSLMQGEDFTDQVGRFYDLT